MWTLTPPPPPSLLTSKTNRRYPRHPSVITTCTSGDPLTSLTRLLWGRSLPPSPLISAVRFTWSSTWHLMMRQLAPSDPTTLSYSRPTSSFPSVPAIYNQTNNNSSLHLYVGLPCPWAHRTLIVRALLNLEHRIPTTVVVPGADGAWELSSNEKKYLREVYGMRRGGYDGRSTVPMLWDEEKSEVVCNESYEIARWMNRLGEGGLEMEGLEKEIERWNAVVYPNVNNGVYRCGFAQSQDAYDTAVNDLFSTLDMLDSHLSTSRYLCGDVLTLADICLFTTLIRFDLVYSVLFKCTKKKLVEYPNLHGYTRDIYQIPKVAGTCNFEAIMDGYYRTLFPLNPGSIKPVMPSVCEHDYLSQPHNRESLSSNGKHPRLSPV